MPSKEEQKVLRLFKNSPQKAYDYVWELKETARICEDLWLKTCVEKELQYEVMGRIMERSGSTVRKKLVNRGLIE